MNFVCVLKQKYPNARVALSLFGSHGAMLDVIVNGEFYVLEWDEAEGFGVTFITEENRFTRGSDAGFATLHEAEQYLLAQLA